MCAIANAAYRACFSPREPPKIHVSLWIFVVDVIAASVDFLQQMIILSPVSPWNAIEALSNMVAPRDRIKSSANVVLTVK